MKNKGMVYLCFFVAICLCGFSLTAAQTGDKTKALVESLLSNYSTRVRPNKDHSKPMQVDLDLFLVGINGIDAVEGKLTTTGYLYISWVDEYLNWMENAGGMDSLDYSDIMQIYLSQSDIWKPDITLQNGFTKIDELGSAFVQVKVVGMGLVLWQPFEIFQSKCNIDITFFPFDQQTCDLKFVVWSSSIFDVNVTMGNKGIILEDVEDSGEWKIISTTSSEDKEAMESRVTFSLTIERNSQYYVFNIVVPIILLGLLNVFTYVIPADSGEKMGYSMTVFLSFAVFLTIVSSELPRSTGSYLGYYLMMLLGFGVLTVCSTAFQLRLHHRQGGVPPWVAKLIGCKCCCCCSDNKVDDVEMKRKRHTPKTEWSDVTSAIDTVMFWTLITLFLGSTVGVMVILQQRIKLS